MSSSKRAHRRRLTKRNRPLVRLARDLNIPLRVLTGRPTPTLATYVVKWHEAYLTRWREEMSKVTAAMLQKWAEQVGLELRARVVTTFRPPAGGGFAHGTV
jgi:hypothetical protein